MKRETYDATKRLGLVVAISLIQQNPGMPGEEEDIPYSLQPTEESAGEEPEREEEKDIDEIERPEPDIDEIHPDDDPEIDTGYEEEEKEEEEDQL